MKNFIFRYQHHLLVLLALGIVNYVLLPLSELQVTQHQQANMLLNQKIKTEHLLDDRDLLMKRITDSELQIDQLLSWLYLQTSEADFKLTAQKNIEQVLTASGCNIDRFGFTGGTELKHKLSRWLVKVRLKGDALCLISATRALETLKPLVKIESYVFNNKAFNFDLKRDFNASFELSVWHLKDRI